MGSKILVRGKNDKKPVFKKAKGEAAVHFDNDDSMTLMDVIRIASEPAQKQQQQKGSTGAVVEGGQECHEVIIAAIDLSSTWDEDSVVCQFKRKRKCKDLSDILKRDQPGVRWLTSNRLRDDNSQPRKAKKLEFARKKGRDASVNRNGRRKVVVESSPPASTLPNPKSSYGKLEQFIESRAGERTSELRNMTGTRKSFPDSLRLSEPVAVTDGPALDKGRQQRFQGAAPRSPNLNADRKARSSSQSKLLHTSASETGLRPVSSLHTLADAKNCQNACVAKAVAPELDQMSEEELIYWYEEVTGTKFTCRNGEKVRGRIRRVIRAVAKSAGASTKSSDNRNKSNMSSSDKVEKYDSNFLEPRTPSPGEESARTSPKSGEPQKDTPVPLKDETKILDCRLNTEAGLTLECEQLEVALVMDEPPVVESLDAKSFPIDVAPDVSHALDSFGKRETECGDGPSPASEMMTVTGERCCDIFKSSQSESAEPVLPSVDCEVKEAPSIEIIASHSFPIELKVCEGFGPILNASRVEDRETTSHQSSAGSTKESMACALNSDATELSRPSGNEDIMLPTIQPLGGIGEGVSWRSDDEKSPKIGTRSSLSLPAGERALLDPNVRPSSPSCELLNTDSQSGIALQACDTGASIGHSGSDNCPETRTADVHAVEVAGDPKPDCDDLVMAIQGNSTVAAPDRKDIEKREESNEKVADGFSDCKGIAPLLEYLQDQTTESAEGIPIDLKTSQQVVDICSTSDSEKSVDGLNQLELVDTFGRCRDVEVSVQDEPQQSFVIDVEPNTVGTRVEVCEIQLEDGSHQPARSDTSLSDHNESVKDIDGPSETCSAPKKVNGISADVLPAFHCSLVHGDVPEDGTGVWDAEHVRTLQNSAAGKEAEAQVLSLEEYIATHRGENTASHEEDEDATSQGLEEDVAPELMDSQCVGQGNGTTDEVVNEFSTQQMLVNISCCRKSDVGNGHARGEDATSPLKEDVKSQGLDEDVAREPMESQRVGRGDGTTGESVDEFYTQQMLGSVAFCRESDIGNDLVGGIPSPNGREPNEDVALLKLKGICISQQIPESSRNNSGEEISTQQLAKNTTSQRVQGKVLSQLMDESGFQKQAEAGAELSPLEIESSASQDQEGNGTGQANEKGVLSCHNEEHCNRIYLDEGARSVEYKEKEASSGFPLDDGKQGEHASARSGVGVESQANLRVAPRHAAGVDVPHFQVDIADRQKDALPSLEGNVAPDQIAETSESYFTGSEPIQSLVKNVSLHQMDSTAGCTLHELEEHDASKPVEKIVDCPAQGLVEEVRVDHTASADDVNDVAEANNFCENDGEDDFDYPVVLSQPRRSETEEDDIQKTMNDVQRMAQVPTSMSPRITRASLKREKSIRAVEEKLAGSFKVSSPQSPDANSVLPCCPFTCASDWDPHSGEKRETSEKSSADQSLISDAEIEQIDNFEYAILQEEEWQNAGKFSNQIDMSFFEEDVSVSSPRKRKFNDPENDSDRGKRVAVEASLQETAAFGSLQENASETVPEVNSMEDDHVPTALSTALIEKNGERSGAVYTLPSLADQESRLMGQQQNSREETERRIAREKRKMSLEHSPESNCDSAATAEPNGCIDLLACEKLGEDESSQEFEPPSKLLCRRKVVVFLVFGASLRYPALEILRLRAELAKAIFGRECCGCLVYSETISPLSQLELMRASNSNSPPSDDCPVQKIPVLRIKLPPVLAISHHEGSGPFKREPSPPCIYVESSNKTGKDEASNGTAVPLDSSEDDTEDSCSKQGLGSAGSEGEPPRKFPLCPSPSSPSPESVETDSSQEPRDSQRLFAPSSKGILKTGPKACKGLCKCAACSTSRSKAGNATNFIASQMKTFQLIAGHLTKEMQGLRTIIETNLSSPGETYKIQETLKKSKDVEEVAEQNLASLLRDCKRYCKLTATKPIPMRKIVFADEAGKKLCHVKTFQSQSLPKSVLDLL